MVDSVKNYLLELSDFSGNEQLRVAFDSSRFQMDRLSPNQFEIYRFLYREVGFKWGWKSRLEYSDKRIKSILADKNNIVCVLLDGGKYIGFCEFSTKNRPDAKIIYFGLVCSYIGRGLGKLFLSAVAREILKLGVKRIVLTTKSTDHKNALSNYLKFGFKIIDETETKADVGVT